MVVDPSLFFCSVCNQDLTKYLFRNPRENETFLRNALSRNFDHKEKLVSIIFCRTHILPLIIMIQQNIKQLTQHKTVVSF